MSGDVIIRLHHQARQQVFDPREVETPIPLKYIDVMRTTETDLLDKAEAQIEDLWTDIPKRTLSTPWKGRTLFRIRYPEPAPGMTWVNGRYTKKQKDFATREYLA